jgi:hypothetical protein
LYGKYSMSIFSSVATTVSISTLFYASWRGIVSTQAKWRSPVFSHLALLVLFSGFMVGIHSIVL